MATFIFVRNGLPKRQLQRQGTLSVSTPSPSPVLPVPLHQMNNGTEIHSCLFSWYICKIFIFPVGGVLSPFDILISPSLFLSSVRFCVCPADLYLEYITFCLSFRPYSAIMNKCLLILMVIYNGKMNKTFALQHSNNKIVFVYFYLIALSFYEHLTQVLTAK